jgi:hypothetical protein
LYFKQLKKLPCSLETDVPNFHPENGMAQIMLKLTMVNPRKVEEHDLVS